MPINWPVVGTIIAALVAFFGVWLKSRRDQRRTNAEARSADADAESTGAQTRRNLFKDVEELRGRVIAAEDHATACERENNDLKQRIIRLESAMPMALIASRLEDYASLSDIFDLISDPIVILAPNNSGTFVWVNTAFCALLGRTREEILRLGWRKLVDPRDLDDSEATESALWTDNVCGFINRYIHADGHPVRLKWYVPSYRLGVTLCYVSVQRRKDDL